MPRNVDAWRRIVAFVRGHSGAKICLQLGHAGRKDRRSWRGKIDAADGWKLGVIAPTSRKYAPSMHLPRR